MSHKNILGTIGSIFLLLMLTGSMRQNKLDPLNFVASRTTFSDVRITRAMVTANNPDEQIAIANNQFGFKLFKNIVHFNHTKNVFISPTSIAIALAMTYNGASGETQQAMASALELQELSLKDVNLSYQKLQQDWQQSDSQVQLSIANSIWAKQGIPFKHKFLKNNREYYQARITNLDFTNPRAKNIINSWVQEATQGKIERIVGNIKPEDILFLINAIYFKGNWANQFDKKLTKTESFHLSPDFSQPQRMMSQTGKYRYYENNQFQAISLPYGQSRLSMYIFLPRQNSDLATFSQQLNLDNWQQWKQQFQLTPGSITIPRFQLEYEVELKQALTALGMGIAFEANRADFAEMTSQSVLIDRIKHKTFVEVNEEGTEAASVTSIGIGITSVNPTQPFEMIVNRPFFCAIADNLTDTILFMGSVVNPG